VIRGFRATSVSENQRRRPVPNMPLAISAAAVRMNCLKAPDFTKSSTMPSSLEP
jgi:hypothetical protein